MYHLEFNTGRQYSAEGQIIKAYELGKDGNGNVLVYIIDETRNIDMFLICDACMERSIMKAYDRNNEYFGDRNNDFGLVDASFLSFKLAIADDFDKGCEAFEKLKTDERREEEGEESDRLKPSKKELVEYVVKELKVHKLKETNPVYAIELICDNLDLTDDYFDIITTIVLETIDLTINNLQPDALSEWDKKGSIPLDKEELLFNKIIIDGCLHREQIFKELDYDRFNFSKGSEDIGLVIRDFADLSDYSTEQVKEYSYRFFNISL